MRLVLLAELLGVLFLAGNQGARTASRLSSSREPGHGRMAALLQRLDGQGKIGAGDRFAEYLAASSATQRPRAFKAAVAHVLRLGLRLFQQERQIVRRSPRHSMAATRISCEPSSSDRWT